MLRLNFAPCTIRVKTCSVVIECYHCTKGSRTPHIESRYEVKLISNMRDDNDVIESYVGNAQQVNEAFYQYALMVERKA